MNFRNDIKNVKILYITLSYMHVTLAILMLKIGYLSVTQAISTYVETF